MNTDFDFEGATIVVTGASSGIGRQVALEFGRSGATVLNVDVTEDPKDIDADVPTHERIRRDDGEAVYVSADISRRSDVAAAIDAATEYGGVDVMVNNAGVSTHMSLDEISPEDLRRIHETNVYGSFFGTQLAAEDMLKRDQQGCIINTTSISSTLAQQNQIVYDMSKAALSMLTKGAALELGSDGIRVNAVAPGHIATEIIEGLTRRVHEQVERGDLSKDIPLGRAGVPKDVADAYLFLASDSAEYITGETITIDGGWQVY